MSKPHLLQQTPKTLQAWFAAQGLPVYRAVQVRRWLFERRAARFDQMTDLPRPLRSQLARQWTIFTTRVAKHLKADDGTEKLLLKTADQQRIECVLLRDNRSLSQDPGERSGWPGSSAARPRTVAAGDGLRPTASHPDYLSGISSKTRRTICISTQVGCPMGCAFCASGLSGLVRNLRSGEIIEQMLHLQRLLKPEERLTHAVVMGMGEPLLNLDELLPALAEATRPDGLGLSARRITISTVGLPAAIRRLADENCPYHLAVSLHAADERLRRQLVPAGRKHPIAAILAAADDYFQRTGRRITFEYVLLGGLNDRPEHARRLVRLLGGRQVLVNVIPYNRVPELPYRTPTSAATARFVETLRQGNLTAKIRHRKGQEIEAACGQLRRGAEGRGRG